MTELASIPDSSIRGVRLAYGRSGLDICVPAAADVLEPRYLPGVPDEAAAIDRALRSPIESPPLGELVAPRARVGIAICDITRAFPAQRVLPPLLAELALCEAEVTLFVATGTHRLCTPAELEQMLGRDLLERCRVVQHDAFDRGAHIDVGVVPGLGAPALIDASFVAQDVRITTGFIEPHFFAGFSGGPKMLAPGLAALETVLDLHSAVRLSHPKATWGITTGNPVHDAVRGIAERVGITFSLDVTLNRDHAITGVFAGNVLRAHAAGCDFARRTAMVPVSAPYDVVVTTNGGYPLDQNLYQTVKGMSAAAQIVKTGGSILVASECSDGLPSHGGYGQLLRESIGPAQFLTRLAQPGFAVHDQWQVQLQAQIQQKARVHLKAAGLSMDQAREAWLEPVDDVNLALSDLLHEAGAGGRLAVLPEGPQTIPYLVSDPPSHA